jgi:hypothetical protein
MKKPNAIRLEQMFVRTIAPVVLSALFAFGRVEGAETSPVADAGYALTKGTNEFGLWAGGSPDSSRIAGNTEDRKLVLFALRYGRVLAAWDSVSLEYTLDH